MEKGINILILEDLPSDAELAKRELKKVLNNPIFKVVETEEDYVDALQTFSPNLIISDYQLPAFDGMSALKLTKEKFPFIPFIVLTGSMNEDTAVECMKSGADDYVIKEHMKRLGSAALNSIKKKKNEYEHHKAQIALKERELHLSSIIQNPEGYIIYRLKAGSDPMSPIVTHVSPSITDLIGVSYEESKNYLKWFENVHPEDLPRLIKANQKGMKPPFLFEQEFRYIHPTKGLIWLQARSNGIPYENDVNNIEWAHGIITDITRRKHSEQIKKVLYNISTAAHKIDNLNRLVNQVQKEIGTIIDTTNFYIALYDDKTDMFSFPFIADEKEKVISIPAGKSISNYVLKSQESLLANKEKVKEMVKSGDIELVGTASEIWLGVPLQVEEKVIGVLAVQSYTDECAYDESDKNLLEFISDQISISIKRKKAEDELKIALKKATESDRLKSAFLATMSHELRTPLNAIIGFSNIIDKEMTVSEIIRFNNIINESGNHLLSIVEDIFDITLIESGNINIEKKDIKLIDILKNVNQIITMEQQNLKKNLIHLNLIIPEQNKDLLVNTDSSKLKQVFLNLLNNALKFTHEGHINYGYSLIKDNESELLKFFVEDTGIGIPTNKQKFIFDTFRQVEETHTKSYGGMGLGLSISKKIIDMLGGEIWLESKEGKGSTFYFTIPHNTASEEKILNEAINLVEKAEKQIKPEVSKLKTLIVEDDENSEMFLRIIVKSFCKEILIAETGLEAIEVCRKNPDIDLILMDIQMPNISGYEATRRIREFNQDVIIIAQTAFALSGDKEKAIEAGCNDYITKPIKKKILLRVIEQYFSLK